MKYHVRTFYVEGLDLGKERFLWNNQLMFTDGGTKGGNIATAHILLKRPIPDMEEHIDEKFFTQNSKDSAEALHILGIFLACFHLSTKNKMPKINRSMSGGSPLDNVSDFKNMRDKNNPFLTTRKPKQSIRHNMKSLETTIPLFEKVIKNIEFKQKHPKNPLSIALPIYQKIADSLEVDAIIVLVTVLESLISDSENELRYKFALRTSLLVEKTSKKRDVIFFFLKQVYSLRSNLVHGTEISLELFSHKHVNTILSLQHIVKIALQKYIDLVNSGLTKKQIIEKLDRMALGIHEAT